MERAPGRAGAGVVAAVAREEAEEWAADLPRGQMGNACAPTVDTGNRTSWAARVIHENVPNVAHP